MLRVHDAEKGNQQVAAVKIVGTVFLSDGVAYTR